MIEIRPADASEAPLLADLYWRAREAAVPAIPPSVHPLDEIHDYFATVMLPHRDVWVAEEADQIIGMLILEPGWVDHLYLEPDRTGEGIGTQLLDHAKSVQPDGLDLWAFRANTGARRFYERHGFTAIAFTEGDNEEGEPDVRYRWSGG